MALYYSNGNVSFDFGITPYIIRENSDHEIFISNKINPKVSIITPSYNQCQYIEQNILSVARQSYKNFEHLIIDNLSDDTTHQILSKYPHLSVISEKDNGVIDAILKGIFIAKGDYIIMLPTSDGILDEDWLSKCVNILENDNEVSLVWGLVQYVDGNNLLVNSLHHPQLWNIKSPDYIDCPQKENWFDYWKQNKPWGFEISMVVRRDIFIECYSQSAVECYRAKLDNKSVLDFLEFFIFFNKKRYQPYFIRQISNFARIHSDSLSSGLNWTELVENYHKRVDETL